MRKINIVQKKLLRIVLGETDCRLSLNDLITKCGLLSTKGIFYYNLIIENYIVTINIWNLRKTLMGWEIESI